MSWKWTLLDAGRFALDGGSMFGVVPKALWSKLIEPDSRLQAEQRLLIGIWQFEQVTNPQPLHSPAVGVL